MKVRLKKEFGEHKKGATLDVTPERAAYWQRVGVAEPATEKEKKEVAAAIEKAEISEAPEKVTVAPTKEKKADVKATPKKKK